MRAGIPSGVPALFLPMYDTRMELEASQLTEVEELLKDRFSKDAPTARLPSTAGDAKVSARVEQLVLPDTLRGKMPHTKDKYLVRENPHLVQWEREVRKFLRNLSPEHTHRASAVMIYEWATGIKVAELMGNGGSANSDLRKINKILQFYYGRSYTTYICGRKVAKCYAIPAGYYIRRHRPMTLTLYAEYSEGVLYP